MGKKLKTKVAPLFGKTSLTIKRMAEKEEEELSPFTKQERTRWIFHQTFYCPITHAVMRDPVVDINGDTYERTAIEEWISRNKSSPITREAMERTDLRPNRTLRETIELEIAKLRRIEEEKRMKQLKKQSLQKASIMSLISTIIPPCDKLKNAMLANPKDWNKVNDILQQHPEVAQEFVPIVNDEGPISSGHTTSSGHTLSSGHTTSSGMFPLEMAMEQNAPLEIIQTLIKIGGSEKLQQLNKKLMTVPIEWNAVDTLISENPEIVKEWRPIVTDENGNEVNGGFLPIHMALEKGAPMHIVQKLLKIYPECGDEPTLVLQSKAADTTSLFLKRKDIEKGNESPLDIAERCHASKEMIDMLEARPWDPKKTFGEGIFTGADVHMATGLADKISHVKAHRLLKKRSTIKGGKKRRLKLSTTIQRYDNNPVEVVKKVEEKVDLLSDFDMDSLMDDTLLDEHDDDLSSTNQDFGSELLGNVHKNM